MIEKVVHDKTIGEEGQSVVEFVFMLPMLLGITTLLVHINTAIQISIVNQQYARIQTLRLTFNSPFYPALRRSDESYSGQPVGPRTLLNGAYQMVVGVADNLLEGGDAHPVATQQLIVRKPSLTRQNAPQDENATTMGWVRIRNSVTLCTQRLNMNPDGTVVPLREGENFSDYCKATFPYD